jgi:hypothetical protein
MNVRRLVIATVILSVLGATEAGTQAQVGGPFRHENTPDNLKALLQLVFQKIHAQKSLREGAELFRSMVPDESRATKALKERLPPGKAQKIFDFHKTFARVGDEELLKLVRPEQTVVKVHGATTEEITKYQDGSVAFNEFPGGAKQAAEQVLRPGVTFYEVEFLEPGKDAGIKYHLFYWDGRQWSMLGPVWRALS